MHSQTSALVAAIRKADLAHVKSLGEHASAFALAAAIEEAAMAEERTACLAELILLARLKQYRISGPFLQKATVTGNLAAVEMLLEWDQATSIDTIVAAMYSLRPGAPRFEELFDMLEPSYRSAIRSLRNEISHAQKRLGQMVPHVSPSYADRLYAAGVQLSPDGLLDLVKRAAWAEHGDGAWLNVLAKFVKGISLLCFLEEIYDEYKGKPSIAGVMSTLLAQVQPTEAVGADVRAVQECLKVASDDEVVRKMLVKWLEKRSDAME